MSRTEQLSEYKTPDEICAAYAKKKVKITLRTLDDDEDVVLIEGTREALEFLGQLLLAQARCRDCGFQLTPNGAGKALLSIESTKGVYLHRLS
jgi:hypothetical protein